MQYTCGCELFAALQKLKQESHESQSICGFIAPLLVGGWGGGFGNRSGPISDIRD